MGKLLFLLLGFKSFLIVATTLVIIFKRRQARLIAELHE
jgi:hypothetical protein